MRMTDSSRPTPGRVSQVMTEHGNIIGIVSAKLNAAAALTGPIESE